MVIRVSYIFWKLLKDVPLENSDMPVFGPDSPPPSYSILLVCRFRFFSAYIKSSHKSWNICVKHNFLLILFKNHHENAKFTKRNHFTQYVPLFLKDFQIYTVTPWFTLKRKVNQGGNVAQEKKPLFLGEGVPGP